MLAAVEAICVSRRRGEDSEIAEALLALLLTLGFNDSQGITHVVASDLKVLLTPVVVNIQNGVFTIIDRNHPHARVLDGLMRVAINNIARCPSLAFCTRL